MTAKDVIEILAILLAAGLAAEVIGRRPPRPRMALLLAAGVLLGLEALDWVDVPLDALGPQLLFSLGVSLILFYGGLELSLAVLSRVGVGLGLLAVPGGVLTALVVGAGRREKIALIALMFLGRVGPHIGPHIVGGALVLRERERLFRHPEERPIIG